MIIFFVGPVAVIGFFLYFLVFAGKKKTEGKQLGEHAQKNGA
jgi:hypothetical protein